MVHVNISGLFTDFWVKIVNEVVQDVASFEALRFKLSNWAHPESYK